MPPDMRWIQSKWFQILLALVGIGGSLVALMHYSHWRELAWPSMGVIFLFLASLGEMFFRNLRIQKACLLFGKKISFWESSWMAALADIYGASTPSGVGGEVARMTSLTRLGIKGRDSLMILAADRLVLLVSLITVLIISAILVILYSPESLATPSLFYTLGAYFVLSVGLILFLFFMIRKKEYEMPLKGKQIFLQPSFFILAMIHHVVRLGLLPLSLWVLNHQIPDLKILMVSFVLGYGISLLPMPSGGGSVEVAFMIFFSSLLGESAAAQTLLWWRFTGHYFYVLVGILVTLAGLMIRPQHVSQKTPSHS